MPEKTGLAEDAAAARGRNLFRSLGSLMNNPGLCDSPDVSQDAKGHNRCLLTAPISTGQAPS